MNQNDYIEPAKNGDPEAMQMLVQLNEGYVRKLALLYSIRNPEIRDDLKQEAYLGLVEAVQHFDLKKGVKFLTYAHTWMLKRVLAFVSDRCRGGIRISDYTIAQKAAANDDTFLSRIRPISLQSIIGDENDDCPLTLEDTLGCPEPLEVTAGNEMLIDKLNKSICNLPDWRMRYVVIRYYNLDGEGPATLNEIGETLGYSKSCISKYLNSAISIIKSDSQLHAPVF